VEFPAGRARPEKHHFARMEVLEFLRMAGRRGWRFDAIVLDPPTFATFKSGRWCSRTDYPRLLEMALSVLEPEGILWMAANTEGFPAKSFESMIAGLSRSRRGGRETLAVGVAAGLSYPRGCSGSPVLEGSRGANLLESSAGTSPQFAEKSRSDGLRAAARNERVCPFLSSLLYSISTMWPTR